MSLHMLSDCKFLEIAAGGILEDSQVEFGQDGQDMVKNIGLDGFIIGPGLVPAEHIDLNGEPLGGRRQMPHQERHILADLSMIGQVSLEVGAKDADIGLPTAVRHRGVIKMMLPVVKVDLFLFLLKILFQQLEFAEFLQHFGTAELDGVHIDMNSSLDSTAAGLRHAAPIPEGM